MWVILQRDLNHWWLCSFSLSNLSAVHLSNEDCASAIICLFSSLTFEWLYILLRFQSDFMNLEIEKCTSCDELVHLTFLVFIIIWSSWICEVWGPIRHGGEAGSESWRLWMVFKAADNVEAGRMIRRLLQTISFTYLSVVLYCAGFHGLLLLIRTLCQWTFSIILYFACQHFCFAPQLWYGNVKWLLCNC